MAYLALRPQPSSARHRIISVSLVAMEAICAVPIFIAISFTETQLSKESIGRLILGIIRMGLWPVNIASISLVDKESIIWTDSATVITRNTIAVGNFPLSVNKGADQIAVI